VSVDLSAFFRRFDENISLERPQTDRMDSAADTVAEFLRSKLALNSKAVFLQGSYVNNTAIEPVEGGEYDVDIVAICVDRTTDADVAIKDLEALFMSDGRFAPRVVPKKPCVRLEYAEDAVGSFHVDVVPVRQTSTYPPLEAPRKAEGWHGTAPAEYTQWCTNQGADYVKTVKALKRWRDEQQPVRAAVKSVVLQVLTSQHMPAIIDDSARLVATFANMYRALAPLSSAPIVTNPVLSSENLAARWTDESFRNFVQELKEAVKITERVGAAMDLVDAADAWRDLLGSDFPGVDPNWVGIALSDFSHVTTPAQRGWTEQHDPNASISISATVQLGRGGRRARLQDGEGTVFQGHLLGFKASVQAPYSVDTWWQVANTGGHARDVGGLRGEIFKARRVDGRPAVDQNENWERTAYTGAHLVRALLVRGTNVVAASGWFTVNIFAKGHPFRR
jgi:hypothetical protein